MNFIHVVALVALAAPQIASAGDTTAAALPDLIVDEGVLKPFMKIRDFESESCELQEQCIGALGQRTLLQFSTMIRNIGLADLYLGPPGQRSDYRWDGCHKHWHFDNFVSYTLYTKDEKKRLRGFTAKRAHCIMDSGKSSDATAVAGDAPIAESRKYNCGNQGLQRGWYDLYRDRTPCNWLDITGLPAGDYKLRAEVNPLQRDGTRSMVESNYDNNVIWKRIQVTLPEGCEESPFMLQEIDYSWAKPHGHKQMNVSGNQVEKIKLPWSVRFYCNFHNELWVNENGLSPSPKTRGRQQRKTSHLHFLMQSVSCGTTGWPMARQELFIGTSSEVQTTTTGG